MNVSFPSTPDELRAISIKSEFDRYMRCNFKELDPALHEVVRQTYYAAWGCAVLAVEKVCDKLPAADAMAVFDGMSKEIETFSAEVIARAHARREGKL
jgi:hypothetical protein